MINKKKITVYIAHPAQYLFLRNALSILKSKGHTIQILIKTKDILENLLISDNVKYTNILPILRGNSKFFIFASFLKRTLKIIPYLIKNRPNLLISTDATFAQLGFLLRINRITIVEDDYNVISNLASITYPFTQTILCPLVCDVGKWGHKKVGYHGFMKLSYLHPKIFKSNINILHKYYIYQKYILIRLAKLTAHHDFNIKGLNIALLDRLIELASTKNLHIYISSEAIIPQKYNSYLLTIDPTDMHHILAHAELLISDSQSMSVEAAMLGVPSLRYSDFAGRISVLEELEHKYELTYGFSTDNDLKLISKLHEFLELKDLKNEFIIRRERMLNDKINVSAFLVWFLENYPSSIEMLKNNPQFQYTFN